MPSSCVFQLNKPQAIYFGGEIISGTIILNTSSEKNVRGVNIIFQGAANVKWTEASTISNNDIIRYKSHQVYIKNQTNVYGDGILPPGRHIFTFNIPLPMECPTSLEGKYGNVRYELILKINRYFRSDNLYKKPLTIIKTIDLNLYRGFKHPLTADTTDKICCWPFSRGKILFKLSLPFAAYVPGQNLKYALHIQNHSMTDVKRYRIELSRKIIFTATFPRHKKRSTQDILFTKIFWENCLRLTNRVLEGEVPIPSTPSSTNSDDVIRVEYTLKVVFHLSPICMIYSSYPDITVPIFIGTIPIRESMSVDQQQIMAAVTREVVVNTNDTSGDLPPSYNEIIPPRFEEATGSCPSFIDTDSDAENRIDQFKPLYPMYKK